MTRFLFGRMFFWDLLMTGLILTRSLPRRSHIAVRILAAFGSCTVISMAWGRVFSQGSAENLGIMVLNYFGAYLIVLAALSFLLDLERWSFLYMGTFVWFTQQAANAIDFAFSSQAGMSISNWVRHEVILCVTALAVYWFGTRKFQDAVLQRLELNRVAPIWLAMCLACCGLNSYASLRGETGRAFYLAELCLDLFGVLYLHSLYMLSGLERESENIHFMMEQGRRQYEISRENIEQINIKSHDLRHQIRAFHKQGQINEAVLADMETTIDRYDSTVRTGNKALDILLTEKSLACRSKGIGFTCMAEAGGIRYIEEADLYAMFGNALENAIEAAEKLSDPRKKQISFTMRRVGGFYIVQLQNYTQDVLSFQDGLPRTTKEDKRNHGIGVRSMQLLVEKYGGQMSYQQEEDVVELSLMLLAGDKTEDPIRNAK